MLIPNKLKIPWKNVFWVRKVLLNLLEPTALPWKDQVYIMWVFLDLVLSIEAYILSVPQEFYLFMTRITRSQFSSF